MPNNSTTSINTTDETVAADLCEAARQLSVHGWGREAAALLLAVADELTAVS